MPKIISRKEAKEQGLQFYYTGKSCKYDHVSERYANDGSCVECTRTRYENNKEAVAAYGKERYENNKEAVAAYGKERYGKNKKKILARNKEYRKKHKDKVAARSREYYEENKDKIDAYQREYYDQNRECIDSYQQEYRENNGDRLNDYMSKYRVNNREKFSANGAKYRASKIQRTPSWNTSKDYHFMMMLFRERDALVANDGIDYEVDHEIPLQGKKVSGLHVPSNLRVVTGSDNNIKRNKYRVMTDWVLSKPDDNGNCVLTPIGDVWK